LRNKKQRRIIGIVIAICIIVIGFGRFAAYVNNYYPATDNALFYMENPASDVTVQRIDNTIVFRPTDQIEAGFIFYPGGLVETEAYAPLLEKLAENNIMCVMIEMPFYLAIFDANGARGIQAKYPEIEDWYIGGHSLGGSMACLYADRHSDEYEGLILLAAYSTKDLSDTDLDVLLVRGSEDGVLNLEKYDECINNLPEDYTELLIQGGCHAYFGDYGMQKGDGIPTISVEEQISQTVDGILDMID